MRFTRVKIATFNVNGINGRLPRVLEWLEESRPDVACLQELKSPDDKFPEKAIEKAGYGAIWHGQSRWNGVAMLARGCEPVETRRGLPGDPDDTHSRYIEAAVNGVLIGCLYLPNGNPQPGPKFDYKHKKKDRIRRFRTTSNIAQLARQLREHHITDVFPHMAPATLEGRLPPIDAEQTERFLQGMEGFRVMPWIGGVLNDDCFPKIPGWRAGFVRSIQELLQAHPRLSGVHINIEPWPSGHPELLLLLDEIRAVMPPGKVLSVAAYPPPTRLHPYPEVHWEAAYYREVSRRTDQLAVMMYDTGLRTKKVYTWLMAEWTQEILAASGTTPVLLGLPAYEDVGVGYHHPEVENLRGALPGIHAGLASGGVPANYQGVALYSDWVMDDAEWWYFREHFLKP